MTPDIRGPNVWSAGATPAINTGKPRTPARGILTRAGRFHFRGRRGVGIYAICGVADQPGSGYAPLVEPRTFVRIKRTLAANIKRRRNELGVTQEEAAHRMRMATRHYQKLEAGEVNVTISTLSKVAIALKVDLSALFKREA